MLSRVDGRHSRRNNRIKSEQGGKLSEKTELTEEQKVEIETLSAVLNIEQTADYFGVSERTMRNIFKRDPVAHAAYKRGKAKAIKDVGGSLIEQARAGDTTSMIFYLKTQGKWRETQHIQQEIKETKEFGDIYGDTESESD